jgi:catechol 2,3-dioxygenase-like lactoylglutathione lyase family enzyme
MRFAHVGICALDTRKLAAWYVDVLGFDQVSANANDPPTIFVASPDGAQFELYPGDTEGSRTGNKVQGLRHLGLATDEIETWRGRLAAHEVEIVDDLRTHPNGATTLFFRDGEGNLLHFVQRSPGPSG